MPPTFLPSDVELVYDWDGTLTPLQMQVLEQRRRHDAVRDRKYAYGLLRCVIDNEALADFRFVITELEAVLPDGTRINVPGNAHVEPISLPRDATHAEWTIELSLPVLDESRPNLDSEMSDDHPPAGTPLRSRRFDLLITDEDYGPEFAAEVACRQFTPTLHVRPSEAAADGLRIRIATLHAERDGRLHADVGSGPLLDFNATNDLRARLRDLRETFTAAEDRMRVSVQRFADSEVRASLRDRIRTLREVDALLRVQLSDDPHPKPLWNRLVVGLARLSAVCLPLSARVSVPEYEHDRAADCLREVIGLLERVIACDVFEADVNTAGETPSVRIDATLWRSAAGIYLISPPTHRANRSSEDVPRPDAPAVRVYPAEEMQRLRVRRHAGYSLRESASLGLPGLEGHSVLELDPTSCPTPDLPALELLIVPESASTPPAQELTFVFVLDADRTVAC